MQRDQIACNGLAFDALTAGPEEGECVILLHGFPEFAEEWTERLMALANAGYRAIAIDQRGYSPGARPTAVADYQVWHLVADVIAVADALGRDRFHLIGHDWGGAVAWTVASLHPGRLQSLTVISTPHTAALHEYAQRGDQKQRLQYVDLFRQPGTAETAFLSNDAAILRGVYEGKVPPDRVELYVQRLSEPEALTAAFNWYRALEPGIKLVPLAGRITVPTLYVWSTNDMATASWVDAPYRFEVLEGLTHWVPEEAASETNRLLLQHLGQRP